MNQNEDEVISAFIDGETVEFESRRAMRALLRCERSRGRWERYHAIGEALRGNLATPGDGGFAHAVMSRVEQESLPQGMAERARTQARPAVRVGMAAAVAIIGLLVTRTVLSPDETAVESEVVAFDTSNRLSSAEVKVEPSPLQTEGNPFATMPVLTPDRTVMDSFVVNHAEYASPMGVVPYGRAVGFQLDRH